MFRDLKIIIPAVVIFLLVLMGVYQLYQRTVVQTSPSPSPVSRFPSEPAQSPAPILDTAAPPAQPATGVTSLPETGGR